jgi:diphosphate-dependent phosphofructokinase
MIKLKYRGDNIMACEISALQKERAKYEPKIPAILREGISAITVKEGKATTSVADSDSIKENFPNAFGAPNIEFIKGEGLKNLSPVNVGVVLSGGQAAGGHNVIAGLFDGIKAIHPDSRLFGFLGGPKGVIDGNYKELTAEIVDPYRNTGGFDMICSGRDKIETKEEMEACKSTCEKLNLNALVVIGGDDSNTNAAVLGDFFLEKDSKVGVVGVPKTIDGDLRNEQIDISFGFDTACKLYSEIIGNICRDANSARKYWHFIKLMGRSASHVTLECALQTHANITIIGEEIEDKNMTLKEIVEYIADVVKKRSEAGKNFGVCLVPEGLIEFVPEIRLLISELNIILHDHKEYFETLKFFSDQQEFVNQNLSRDSSYVFSTLPARIQQQLLYDRDSHGNVQVSRIETEKLIIEQVRELIDQWTKEKGFKGKFSAQSHFLGYEGRCCAPSNFDADYTYALGRNAVILIAYGKTCYMSAVQNLSKPADQWKAGGVPITSLMNMEMRKGKLKPVIQKALTNLEGKPFKVFAEARDRWEMEEDYQYPGSIQYFGTPEVCDAPTITVVLEAKE